MQSLGPFQALADEIKLALRRRDAALQFLLKRVQDINPGRESHCVDCPLGVAAVILDQFKYAGATETLERFRVGRRLAQLTPALAISAEGRRARENIRDRFACLSSAVVVPIYRRERPGSGVSHGGIMRVFYLDGDRVFADQSQHTEFAGTFSQPVA